MSNQFIKLSDEEGTVLISIEDISTVCSNYGKTKIALKSDTEVEWTVNESPDEIIRLLEANV